MISFCNAAVYLAMDFGQFPTVVMRTVYKAFDETLLLLIFAYCAFMRLKWHLFPCHGYGMAFTIMSSLMDFYSFHGINANLADFIGEQPPPPQPPTQPTPPHKANIGADKLSSVTIWLNYISAFLAAMNQISEYYSALLVESHQFSYNRHRCWKASTLLSCSKPTCSHFSLISFVFAFRYLNCVFVLG